MAEDDKERERVFVIQFNLTLPSSLDGLPSTKFPSTKFGTGGTGSLQGEGERQTDRIFRLVKIGFSAKRKMLKNNLAAGYYITPEEAEKRVKKAGFNPKIRAQELSLEDWVKLLGEFG